jgi:hypothetical protein
VTAAHNIHSIEGVEESWTGGIGYNWKSTLVTIKGTGKKSITMEDYVEQILEPAVALAYIGIIVYDASTGGHFMGDGAPIHETKKGLVTVKEKSAIPLHPHLNKPEALLMTNGGMWHIHLDRYCE